MAGICLCIPTACCLVKSSAWPPGHWAIAWSGRPSCGSETRTIISTLPGPCRRPSNIPRCSRDLIDNLITHGFRRVMLLNGHGGNIVPAQQAIFEARRAIAHRDDLLLLAATYWILGSKPNAVDPTIEQKQMGHACEWETSMILHLTPIWLATWARSSRYHRRCHSSPATQGWITKGTDERPATSATRAVHRAQGRNTFQHLLPRCRHVPGTGDRLGWAFRKWLNEHKCVNEAGHKSGSAADVGDPGPLLLATMLMYMDRQALAQQKTEILASLQLSNEDYGRLEKGFGLAFAIGESLRESLPTGSVLAGYIRRFLLGWSAVGFATGWVTSYNELLVCRVLLGFFEAGHWPCAW